MTGSLMMKLYDLCVEKRCWMQIRPDGINGVAVIFDIFDHGGIDGRYAQRFAMLVRLDRLKNAGSAYEDYVVECFKKAIEDVQNGACKDTLD